MERTARSIRWAGIATAFQLLLCAWGTGAASADWGQPERTSAVSWSLVSIDGPRTITYGFETGYCVGMPKPAIDHTRVAWHRRSAVVTVFVHFPAMHFGKDEACGGVGLGVNGKLELAHSIVGRALYDGSASPPERRSHRIRPTLRGLTALSALVAWLLSWPVGPAASSAG